MEFQLAKLYETTAELVSRINEVSYEELTDLVELREQVVHELMPPSERTEDEKQLLHRLGEFDADILARMTHLREEAQNGIRKISQTRVHRKVYQPGVTAGSFFFDKKN